MAETLILEDDYPIGRAANEVHPLLWQSTHNKRLRVMASFVCGVVNTAICHTLMKEAVATVMPSLKGVVMYPVALLFGVTAAASFEAGFFGLQEYTNMVSNNRFVEESAVVMDVGTHEAID